MAEQYTRHIKLDKVINFRDIGGYAGRDGRTVAWRRIFRSGELSKMTPADQVFLSEKIALNSVLDLRSELETKRGISPLAGTGVGYYNIPFMTDGGNREEEDKLFARFTNIGQFYLHLVRRPEFGKCILEALNLIAEPDNHPMVYHCAVGKDRTGILTAVLLSVLGATDEDIIEDYTLSAPFMEELVKNFHDDPELKKAHGHLPAYFWEATSESMEIFLKTLKDEYGSIEKYLYAHGAKPALIENLRQELLV